MWQCGLTVTFLLKECNTEAEAAIFSMKQSEIRVSKEKSADTFLVRVKTKDDRASLLAVLAPEKASA